MLYIAQEAALFLTESAGRLFNHYYVHSKLSHRSYFADDLMPTIPAIKKKETLWL